MRKLCSYCSINVRPTFIYPENVTLNNEHGNDQQTKTKFMSFHLIWFFDSICAIRSVCLRLVCCVRRSRSKISFETFHTTRKFDAENSIYFNEFQFREDNAADQMSCKYRKRHGIFAFKIIISKFIQPRKKCSPVHRNSFN